MAEPFNLLDSSKELIASGCDPKVAETIALQINRSVTGTVASMADVQILRSEIGSKTDSLKSAIDQLRVETNSRFDTLESSVNSRFDKVDSKFESFQTNMDSRFDKVDSKFESLQSDMNTRFEKVDSKFESIQTKKDSFRSDTNANFSEMKSELKNSIMYLGCWISALFLGGLGVLFAALKF